MPEIFLSYRRADAPGTVGRLFDRLSQHFGAEQVFRDIDCIEAGDNFEQSIRYALHTATAVLVVVGSQWLNLRQNDGTRRIDDPLDYVRNEVEIALSSETIVIPVLVENAVLPAPDLLPTSLRELTKHHAAELSHRRWESDVEELLRRLEALGIPALKLPQEPERTTIETVSYGRMVANILVGFVPDLLSLLHQPRRFLGRRTQGRAADVARTLAFFVVAVLLALALLSLAYTPQHSVLGFLFSGFVMSVLGAMMLSPLLWIAWRLAGATRHYLRLLIVLLHQVAVLHLVGFLAVLIALSGLELASRNVVRDIMNEAMKPGSSLNATREMMWSRMEPLGYTVEARVAFVLGIVVLIAGAAWMVRSWGAYRDAFGLSRARSIAALMILALLACAGSGALALIV